MKYLKIHIIIVMSVVILWTLLELSFIHIVAQLRFLWDFKVPRKVWSTWTAFDNDRHAYIIPTNDKTLKDTIIRRYEWFFE